MKRLILFLLSSIIIFNVAISQSGTKITSSIVPNSFLDNYSTHQSKYGKGGYRSVKTITERDAIFTSRRDTGMLVYVSADEKIYILKNGIANANWEELKLGNNTSTDTVAYTKNSIPITTSGYTYAFRSTGTNTNYSVFVSTYEKTQGPVDSRYTKANNSITVYPAVNCNLDVLIVLNSFSQGQGSGGSGSTIDTTKLVTKYELQTGINSPFFIYQWLGGGGAEFEQNYNNKLYTRLKQAASIGQAKSVIQIDSTETNIYSVSPSNIESGYVFSSNGLSAADNYTSQNIGNLRWIPDRNYVDSIVSAGCGGTIDTTKFVTKYNFQTGITGNMMLSSPNTLSMLRLRDDYFMNLQAGKKLSFTQIVADTSGAIQLAAYGKGTIRYYQPHTALSLDSAAFRYIEHKTNSDPLSIPDKFYVDSVMVEKHFSGNLTDGAPTNSEIWGIVGIDPTTAGNKFRCIIFDTDGTYLIYEVRSDGSYFYYTVMTRAL